MCILVDLQVVQVEWFLTERASVLKRVGHDQSPCEIRLRTKIAVGREQDVLFVKNAVESIGFYLVTQQDFFA